MAILKRTKRHATARAATECTLLCLGKLEFIHLLQNPSKSNNKDIVFLFTFRHLHHHSQYQLADRAHLAVLARPLNYIP